jgi:hypothetical protein
MDGGRPVRGMLALLIGWTVLREAEVGPLRSLLHGPVFAKLAYRIVIVGASPLTLARARSVRRREGLAWALIGVGSLLWASGDATGPWCWPRRTSSPCSPLGVAINLADPIGDLILLAVVVASFALRGWRADRTWALRGLAVRPGRGRRLRRGLGRAPVLRAVA